MSSFEEGAATTLTSAANNIDENSKPSLSAKNYLNVVAYVLNVILVYGVGTAGWLGTPTNQELSSKYQTLVTPRSSAFAIWAVIFLSQGAFSLIQLLPRFRASPMVRDGVGYWYCAVVGTQIGWTFAFAYEVIPLSLMFMLLIWISLVALLYRQYHTESDGSPWEFWALRFPFAVHAGWITAASALNVNVQLVSMDRAADVQLGVAIVSLAVLHAVSVWVLFMVERPNWTIACVLSWAFGWIYAELGSPNEKIEGTFSEQTIDGVRYAAIAVAVIIALQIVVRLGLLVRPSWNPYKRANAEEETANILDSDENVKVWPMA